ncbi:SET domain-containing protein [Pseudovirgaria hyperparasitica]|uniref:SET domain-containing protein n=1 Tax=Pseudovirgaria hyperparasitica TaxID=470096 RepID=A0A6A6VUA4_9PEZI|nr:SET domain-containing protein [Pseudovirgaria hyperparasitica]KAF2753366.1 SET domain-containing protein [Pseudovirgaria hyperparasitica]
MASQLWAKLIPANAAFEIRESPGKGFGAFATKKIAARSCILRERPLFVIVMPWEVVGNDNVVDAYRSLGPQEQQIFQAMIAYETEKNGSEFRFPEYATMLRNKFSQPPCYEAMCVISSRLNHACLPNAACPIDEEADSGENISVAMFALRDIAEGEEITFNYNEDWAYMSTHIRRAAMRWAFECSCPVCHPNNPLQPISNMRRALLRGLRCLAYGEDLPPCAYLECPVTLRAMGPSPGGRNPRNWGMWYSLAGYIAEAEGLPELSLKMFERGFFHMQTAVGANLLEAHEWRTVAQWGEKSLEIGRTLPPECRSQASLVATQLSIMETLFYDPPVDNIERFAGMIQGAKLVEETQNAIRDFLFR